MAYCPVAELVCILRANCEVQDLDLFDDNEVYPNQPLSDVACEVRFKGEMQVECERHLFWEAIRSS